MEEVHILPASGTPEVFLNPKGIIKIRGRAIDENVTKFHKPIMSWIDAYLLKPAESTEVIIALEYLNSYNTVILTSILKKVSQVIQQEKKLDIYWYYEEDDDDILERGLNISSVINIPIRFSSTKKITDI
jgi:hypothetical protein